MKEKITELLDRHDPKVQELVGKTIELEQQYISYPDSNRYAMSEVLTEIRNWIEMEARAVEKETEDET